MRLFLFDIDGTLLDAHRAGYHSLVGAMQTVFGTAGDPAGYDWRGKTDPLIVRDVLRAAGVSDETVSASLSPMLRLVSTITVARELVVFLTSVRSRGSR